jgi:hypothetical protein
MQDEESEQAMDFDANRFLQEAVNIDDLLLDQEFIKLPGQLAHYTANYAEAVRDYLMTKLNVETTRARAHLRLRAEAELGNRKMTVADLDALVSTDQDYIAAAIDLIEADVARQKLRGIVDAVTAKKDMLQSLGAKLRAEMQGDPIVRNDQRKY